MKGVVGSTRAAATYAAKCKSNAVWSRRLSRCLPVPCCERQLQIFNMGAQILDCVDMTPVAHVFSTQLDRPRIPSDPQIDHTGRKNALHHRRPLGYLLHAHHEAAEGNCGQCVGFSHTDTFESLAAHRKTATPLLARCIDLRLRV